MGLFSKKINTDRLAGKGNRLFDKGDYAQAINIWLEALGALDKPLNTQSEAVWFQTSIADAMFMQGRYETAYDYLTDAVHNLSGEGNNPFVYLRLGQCSYELGRQDAKEYLLKAYMLEGENIFENEDKKYLDFIRELI